MGMVSDGQSPLFCLRYLLTTLGDVWYTAEAGVTQVGRPMPFVFWNVSDVTVDNFFVRQPPLWSLNIMNGTNMYASKFAHLLSTLC